MRALRGSVRRAKRDRVLRAALAVPGVKAVLNRFETDEPSGLIDDAAYAGSPLDLGQTVPLGWDEAAAHRLSA